MISTTELSNEVRPLNELFTRGDTSELQLKAFLCNNLGHNTLLAKIPMYEFFRISDVANERSENGTPVAQRKLDTKHATELARYILKGLIATTILMNKENEILADTRTRLQEMIGKQPYQALQPIVVNLRTAGINGSNLRAQQIETSDREGVGIRLWLGQRDILWVVDGQHRRKAIQMVIEFLEEVRLEQKYPPKKQSLFPYSRDERHVPQDELAVWGECYELTRGYCTVSVDIHLGLNIIEERQLFHDLNNLSKKVEKSLALEFDSSNPVNAFIKDELIEGGLITISASDKANNWDDDNGSLTRKDIVAINAHLILNKSNINGAAPAIVQPRLNVAKRFWEAIVQIPDFGEENAKANTVAAQPVVLKAIAKLTYDFAFGRFKNAELLDILLDGVTDIDFSHDNIMWRYYQLTPEEVAMHNLGSLENYLPDNSTGNRDIGNYDAETGWMRFGSKHNDIFPIIGDMIRWKLNLPSRHQ